jgi:hypothetical protein
MQDNSNRVNQLNKFSDFADEESQFSGDKVSIEKLVNIPLVVRQLGSMKASTKKQMQKRKEVRLIWIRQRTLRMSLRTFGGT